MRVKTVAGLAIPVAALVIGVSSVHDAPRQPAHTNKPTAAQIKAIKAQVARQTRQGHAIAAAADKQNALAMLNAPTPVQEYQQNLCMSKAEGPGNPPTAAIIAQCQPRR
jgi:hypothetical protein